jgi:hypothetical protein
MRHRFFMEDDLIKVGWGNEGSLEEWDTILVWVLRKLDLSEERLHLLLDFSELYHISEEVFQPQLAQRLAAHPQAGQLLLVSPNPVFVHFVNQHWITQAEDGIGLRAFLDTTDALSWLRGRFL